MTRSFVLLVLAACAGATTDSSATGDTGLPATGDCEAPEAEVITVTTQDGVDLEADWYPSSEAGAPGIVLLHMIPPSNDRTGWPSNFIGRLGQQCWNVVALDRRGAGGSSGDAVEAYEGPNGKFDVEAAVGRLTQAGAGDLAIIGASNGTTSLVDYTVWAAGEGLPEPVAVGFMTGGTYTEEQNAMEDLPGIPAVFTYSTAERDWSEAQRPLDSGDWSFLEYDGGDHGTRMFEAKPKVKGDLVDFFAAFL